MRCRWSSTAQRRCPRGAESVWRQRINSKAYCNERRSNNVADHLPDKLKAWVDAKPVKAFNHPDPEVGLRNAKSCHTTEESLSSATASLREEISPSPGWASNGATQGPLPSAHCIGSMNSIAQAANANVTSWRDLQWCCTGSPPTCATPMAPSAAPRATNRWPQLPAAHNRHAYPSPHLSAPPRRSPWIVTRYHATRYMLVTAYRAGLAESPISVGADPCRP